MMRDPKDVTYHLELFDFFERYAAFGGEARAMLEFYAEEFRAVAL